MATGSQEAVIGPGPLHRALQTLGHSAELGPDRSRCARPLPFATNALLSHWCPCLCPAQSFLFFRPSPRDTVPEPTGRTEGIPLCILTLSAPDWRSCVSPWSLLRPGRPLRPDGAAFWSGPRDQEMPPGGWGGGRVEVYPAWCSAGSSWGLASWTPSPTRALSVLAHPSLTLEDVPGVFSR